MTIKEIIDSLSEDERKLLNYAFENSLSQFVRLPGGKFVGVNVSYLTYLEPDLIAGKWTYGRDTSSPRNNGKIKV